jgi:hypothetical protein
MVSGGTAAVTVGRIVVPMRFFTELRLRARCATIAR